MMRTLTFSLVLILLLAIAGCSFKSDSGSSNSNSGSTSRPVQTEVAHRQEAPETTTSAGDRNAAAPNPGYQKASYDQKSVSLADGDKAQAAQFATERKIIRNAEMVLEIASPNEGQRRITQIAESHGGFVVTTEARQRNPSDQQTQPETSIKIVVRVPSDQFSAALDEIRGTGSRVWQEKTTGQDVTEEYLDLEARIKTKKALEAQFLEIMKQAHTVADALEVQRQIAEVRTEIERLEGRRRFLENQSSLSTITVTLQTATPIVNTTGFFYNVKRAFGGGVDVAAAITLFLIEAVVALLPVVLFILLPIGLVVRYLIRRARRQRLARQLVQEDSPPLPQP